MKLNKYWNKFSWIIIIYLSLIIKKEKCICLSEYPTTSSLPLNQCNFDCLLNNRFNTFLECGGSAVYSLFISGKWILIQHFTNDYRHNKLIWVKSSKELLDHFLSGVRLSDCLLTFYIVDSSPTTRQISTKHGLNIIN